MTAEIFNYPELNRYLTSFEPGRIIFLEGDDSQDLFILESGRIEIVKGNKIISEISKKGEFFGEMSFLLGAKRTATAKAVSDVHAIRIPKSEINNILNELPLLGKEITKLLAHRLDETSQVLYGLKEFCDQLPDAVIVTNREDRILSWNSVAEKMYGLEGDEMHYKPAEEIYAEPGEFKSFLEEVRSRYSVREKILRIKHPQKGTRYISVSTTVLYDGHHNYQGILYLGRDVTAVKNLENHYRRIRNWTIPVVLALGILAVGFFLVYPHFTREEIVMDIKKQGLRDQIGRDYFLMRSLLLRPFSERNRNITSGIMSDFLGIRETESMPYLTILLLDEAKQVFDAVSADPDIDASALIGSSYAGIDFQGREEALNRFLVLYRTDSRHPLGRRGVEMAFKLEQDRKNPGWLVFHMDMDGLLAKYDCTEEDLKAFQFQRPKS